MDIEALIDMPDPEYTDVVLAAVRRREAFPRWWRAVLRAEVIDETERIIREARIVGVE